MSQPSIFAQPLFLTFRKKIKSAMFDAMFKPKSRTFPPGTFIPTPLRVVAIIHLCIAFSALLYEMGYPFMGKLFEQKRMNVIYESVIQNTDLFQQLPYEKQMDLRSSHQALLNQMHLPFSAKFGQSIRIILLDLPPFQKAWIFFSIIIPIFILMKIDGAHRASWILPIIALVIILNQHFIPSFPQTLKENALFPSEITLLDQYLEEPLAAGISEQREQLIRGWHLYLINEWTDEQPALTQDELDQQVSKGLFSFNIARIGAIRQDSLLPPYLRGKGQLMLAAFLVWNLFFAWFANRRKWFY